MPESGEQLMERIRATLGHAFDDEAEWELEVTDKRTIWHAETTRGHLSFYYSDEDTMLYCAAQRGGRLEWMKIEPSPTGYPVATALGGSPLSHPGLN